MTPDQLLDRGLAAINARAATVEARRAWYEGNHPCEFTTVAYDKTFRDQMKSLIENQCRKVVDKRSSPLIPIGYKARRPDARTDALAEYATDRIQREADKVRRAVRTAKWAGVPVPVLVDYNHKGEPDLYPLDPAWAHAEVDSSGALLFLVWVWRNADNLIHATVIDPAGRYVYATNASIGWPAPGEYKLTDTLPNPFGYVPAVVFDEGGSIIDDIWPLNAALNTAHQVAHLLGNKAVNPTTIWWGLQVLDPNTGMPSGPKPNINPATGASDIAIPVGADETGNARRVEQLASRSPKEWEEVKRGYRHAIWSMASTPASMVDVGGGHAGEGTLEADGLLFSEVAREDRQVYDGPESELGNIIVDARMVRLTGATVGVDLAVVFNNSETSTETAKVNRFATLVGAGMTIRDAAIRALGATPQEADELQANADAHDAGAVEAAGRQFLAGM